MPGTGLNSQATDGGVVGTGGKTPSAKKKGKKIYRPVPWLDNFLTAIFLAEVVWSVYMFGRNSDDLLRYGAALVFTAVAVVVVKTAAKYFGLAINSMLPWRPLTKRVNLKKFQEQSWQFVAHVVLAAADWGVMWDEPWYTETKTLWVPGPLEAYHKPALRMVFMLQLGVWVYTCIIHRFFDKRRKDYFVMFAHHVVTIGLVAGSGAYGYFRIAVVILAVHDVSDIGVDLLKLVNYLQLEGTQGLFLTEITFVANLVVWIYFRLWVFPTKIMWTCIVELHKYLQPADNNPYPGEPWKDPFNVNITMYYSGNFMLLCLISMHIWWTFLFLRLAYKLLTGEGGHKAGQQEYEGDSEIEGQSTGTENEAEVEKLRHAHRD